LIKEKRKNKMEQIEKEWEEYKLFRLTSSVTASRSIHIFKQDENIVRPEPSELFISTKTHIVSMETEVDVMKLFWDTPIIDYYSQQEGIVKKQCLTKCFDKDTYELQLIDMNRQPMPYKESVTIHIDNPEGRLKFKDVRKITVGVSKHDFVKLDSKPSRLFYNCCILILRIDNDGKYEEYHIKIFKTGKIELPGSKNDVMFQKILTFIKIFLNQNIVSYQAILCNTNFTCNYNIHRDKLHELLVTKYRIQSSYYPSSHHAIQAKLYFKFNNDSNSVEYLDGFTHAKINNSTRLDRVDIDHNGNIFMVSCMIFRTGSVLISTRKYMDAVVFTYNLLVKVFKDDFAVVNHGLCQIKPLKNTNFKTNIKQVIVHF
jgi:hypothetical protein